MVMSLRAIDVSLPYCPYESELSTLNPKTIHHPYGGTIKPKVKNLLRKKHSYLSYPNRVYFIIGREKEVFPRRGVFYFGGKSGPLKEGDDMRAGFYRGSLLTRKIVCSWHQGKDAPFAPKGFEWFLFYLKPLTLDL